MKTTPIVASAFLLGACVKLGHIQQTEAVRTLNFKGSHQAVAECIQQRLGGKVTQEPFGSKYVIYNSVKNRGGDGLTHYAITVVASSASAGYVEWRIMRPPQSGPNTAAYNVPPLSDTAVQEFWGPVEDCAARVQRAT